MTQDGFLWSQDLGIDGSYDRDGCSRSAGPRIAAFVFSLISGLNILYSYMSQRREAILRAREARGLHFPP